MSKKARNWLIGIIGAVIIVPIIGVSVWTYGDSHTEVESHSEQP